MNIKFQQVYQLVDQVLKTSQNVSINRDQLVARYPEFLQVYKEYQDQNIPVEKDPAKIDWNILFYLMTGSINFCFWEGNSTNRPVPGGSTAVWAGAQQALASAKTYQEAIHAYKVNIRKLPFPLSPERTEMLSELEVKLPPLVTTYRQALVRNIDLTDFAGMIANDMPVAYGQDRLLKRVSLAVELLHEATQLGSNVQELPIPADYQVPKVLNAWGILKYSKELEHLVKKEVDIPRNSLEELELRATTIQVGRIVFQESGVPPHVFDRFVWGLRKQFSQPHHLTVTTDY